MVGRPVLALVSAALLAATPVAAAGAGSGEPPASACARHAALFPGAPAPPGGEPGCAAALSEACDAGRRLACFELGLLLEAGTPGPADPARALALHRRACAAGVGGACTRAAALLRSAGDGAAEAMLEDGCGLGDGAACLLRSEREADPERAGRLRERACDLGEPRGCLALAAGAPPDRAVPLLARGCRLGAAEACARGAAALSRGDAGTPDEVAARAMLERGCELGGAEACARLGVALLREGRPGEAARGGRLLTEHCRALGVETCLDAAEAYLHGASSVVDDRADPPLLEAACARGLLDACAALGRILQEGRAAPADGPRAAALYRRACQGGVARACSDLGVLHRFGAGVRRDEGRARRLFERACEDGVEEACRLRDDPVRPSDGR
jgi:TPR repeat protein